ncbi:ABC transporter permease [Ulvibacterium sp.]|uniref:ABC transporter permease n=1 Tax=Ulvibacterium sp. TaxID=2665914 RepID=UPI003BAD9799
MVINYLKVAWRNFIKHKGYAVLNISGLAIGLAAVILVFLYIQDEKSYDTMHPDSNTLFGIGETFIDDNGEKFDIPFVPSGWAQLLKERVPGVAGTSHVLLYGYPHSVRNPEDDKTILTQDGEIFMVDQSFAEILHFPLLHGNREEVFEQPNSIVLSEKAANILFGSTDVVGQVLEIKNIFISQEYANLIVTGVVQDYPSNSHIRPDYLISKKFLNTSSSFQEMIGIPVADYFSSIDGFQMPTYVRIDKGANIDLIETEFERVLAENLQEKSKQHDPFFQKITNFHFDKKVNWSGWKSAANSDFMIVLGFIGFIILLIASINYMNLATARSMKRSKEVGVRKSLGSSRSSLIFQFFQESLLTSFLGLLIALALVALMLPAFNHLADKTYTIASFFQIEILFGLVSIWLVMAFIAGSYPAVVLSGFKPIQVLKGGLTIGKGHSRLRKALVLSQLTISVLLLICTGIILQQMNMLQNSKLYDNANQVVSIRYGGGIAPIEDYNTLKNEILRDPDIEEVTLSVHLPQRWGPWQASFELPEISGEQKYDWIQLPGDYDFPEVFDLEFLAGRSFRIGSPADSSNVILNETAVRSLDMTPNEILGQSIKDVATNIQGTVIGVVKDFSFESIRTQIKPMAIQGKPQKEDQILYVKIPATKLGEKLMMLEGVWKKILPGVGFDYWFLSEEFGRMYATEQKMSDLIWFFSMLAIFIACLGLYGLASYMAEQRTKEIGVRKILGASVPQILVLLVSDFVKLVVISCLVAFPIGYWVMNNWLQSFAYKINIGWEIFVISLMVILGLTLLTISYESIRASIEKPTKSLRYE